MIAELANFIRDAFGFVPQYKHEFQIAAGWNTAEFGIGLSAETNHLKVQFFYIAAETAISTWLSKKLLRATTEAATTTQEYRF